ncbi:hypothetical protein, partial [Kitasatospora sp. NPDC059599]|uniref:hypothetical protein n=1 Tax=Kitasatospora sp. NPDC059599 TaxID=3346880 RepID=UPI0036AE6C3B
AAAPPEYSPRPVVGSGSALAGPARRGGGAAPSDRRGTGPADRLPGRRAGAPRPLGRPSIRP